MGDHVPMIRDPANVIIIITTSAQGTTDVLAHV